CCIEGNWFPCASGAKVPYVTPLTRKRSSPTRRNFPSAAMRAAVAGRDSRRTWVWVWTAVLTIGRSPFPGNFLLYQWLAVDPDAAAEGLEAQRGIAAAAELGGKRTPPAGAPQGERHLGIQVTAEGVEGDVAARVLGNVQLD